MSYSATILADHITEGGARLTTLRVTHPRFILAEVNTHRVLSRNSASSRAIPPERIIENVLRDPFVPETFHTRVKGMGVGSELADEQQHEAKGIWLVARDRAVEQAQELLELGIDKSRINRLLEPFMWHTAIISSVRWENFYSLRCPEGDEVDPESPAQLEFQHTALAMRQAMRESEPTLLRSGEWSLPLVTAEERDQALGETVASGGENPWMMLAKVSGGRCARVSFDTLDRFEELGESLERAEKLKGAFHLSPFEHPATPESSYGEARGNFPFWVQYRQLIPHENEGRAVLEERGTYGPEAKLEGAAR